MNVTKKITIPIKGMHCADCALNIERSLQHLTGVVSADVSYVSGMATIVFDPSQVALETIKGGIRRPGYKIREVEKEIKLSFRERYSEHFLPAIVGLLLLLSWVFTWWKIGPDWLKLVFAFAGAVLGGYPILKNAVSTLISLNLNVNVLVSTAIIASLAIGEYKAAATVAFIMLLGELLEEYTVGKTRRAISELVELRPHTATVLRSGKEIEIETDLIEEGDTVIVKSGGRVPVDGIIISGDASLNQAPVTGESMPVEKKKGDTVYSGSISEVGTIHFKATKVGGQTTIARIIKLVEEAQENKAPIQRLTDRYAAWFIPIIIVVAVGVYYFTGDIRRAITILIVACPCALVLATPTAVIAGIGSAARRGIMIKGGAYLEAAGRVNTLILDKTGTLTKGHPQVVAVYSFSKYKKIEILRLAATAQKRSEHPLARAVMEKAKESGIDVPEPDDFHVYRGKGVSARLGKNNIIIGSRGLLLEKGIGVPRKIDALMKKRENAAETVLIVANNMWICGVISVSDVIREGAIQTVTTVRQTGIKRVIMLTGDNPRTAYSIASEIGIDEVKADLLPEDKVHEVKQYIREGYNVAMVGDGINDAPALAAANVGIAMGAVGSEVAIEAADIALMSDDLTKIPAAIKLSHRALNIIRQNLFFAVVFNAAMIYSAAQGRVTPVLGAILHQISSLVVILNSVRLVGFRRSGKPKNAQYQPIVSKSKKKGHGDCCGHAH